MGILRRRGLARVAVVGGAGYAIGKSRGKKSGQQTQSQPEPQDEPSTSQNTGELNEDKMNELEKLGKLHENGTLTDAEFASAKRKILDT